MNQEIAVEFFWNHGVIPTTGKTINSPMAIEFLGAFANVGGGNTSGGAVASVNGKTGPVELAAVDVGADVAGSALAVQEVLQPQITVNKNALLIVNTLIAALQGGKADLSYVSQAIADLVNSDAQTLATLQSINAALTEYEDLLEALDYTVGNRVRFDTPTQGLQSLQQYNARVNINAEEAGTAALLIAALTASDIGAVTPEQLALKQDKLPLNGTAGQFLASDLTWQAPPSGAGIIWTAVTLNAALTSAGLVSGFANGRFPLMLGKDAEGNVYIKGAFTNTYANLISGVSNLFTMPASHFLAGFAPTASTCTLTTVRYMNSSNPVSVSTAYNNFFATLLSYQGIQTFGLTNGIGGNQSCYFPQQAIGFTA